MAKLSSLNPQKNLTFGLLPEPERMNGAYTASAIINVCLLGLFVAISLIALHQKIVAKQQESLTLLMPLKPAAIPKPRPHVHVTPPPPELLRNIAPKIVFQHTTAENAPRMTQVKMRAPNAPVLPPYKPADVALPPQPKVGLFQSNVPTAVANNQGKPTTKKQVDSAIQSARVQIQTPQAIRLPHTAAFRVPSARRTAQVPRAKEAFMAWLSVLAMRMDGKAAVDTEAWPRPALAIA